MKQLGSPELAEHDAGSLSFHLLGRLPWEDCQQLQRQLAEEAERAEKATILLAEHTPHITVGRQGSWDDIRYSARQLRSRQLKVSWVRRSGGTILHGPGQLAILPVVPLGWCGWDLARLELQVLTGIQHTLVELGYPSELRPAEHGLWGRSGQLVASGLDNWHNASRFGAYLNVNPEMLDHGFIHSVGRRRGSHRSRTMSCLLAEQQRPVRMSSIRSALVAGLAAQLKITDYHLFTGHPQLELKEPGHVG